jgi:predicted enzyme related to lactoylglutathione lyase
MSKHGVVHIEISAENPQAASQFYAELFGWKMTIDERFDYHQFEPHDGPAGAFSPVSESNPAGTVILYVGTDDVDASLSKAESLGAMVVTPKMEIPEVGWMGIFTDPTGNPIGLFQSMS